MNTRECQVNRRSLSDLARQAVKTTGAAAKMWPECLEVLSRTGRWWLGRPVYNNTQCHDAGASPGCWCRLAFPVTSFSGARDHLLQLFTNFLLLHFLSQSSFLYLKVYGHVLYLCSDRAFQRKTKNWHFKPNFAAPPPKKNKLKYKLYIILFRLTYICILKKLPLL